jgi:hypothetical protein
MIHALLLLVGFVLLGIAYRQFQQTMKLLNSGERTKARVLELVPVRGKNSTTYRPVFGFVTKANQVRRWEYDVSASPPDWEVGEEATIIYNPDDPGQASMIGYWGLFTGTIILAAVAAPFLVIGSGYFLYVMTVGERSVG